MSYTGYECLKIRLEDGVVALTIDHPPINLFDLKLIEEMDRVGREIEVDPDVRVVVVDSSSPDAAPSSFSSLAKASISPLNWLGIRERRFPSSWRAWLGRRDSTSIFICLPRVLIRSARLRSS